MLIIKHYILCIFACCIIIVAPATADTTVSNTGAILQSINENIGQIEEETDDDCDD